MLRINPGDPRELVRLDLTFDNDTWHITDPVPRHIAEDACRIFGEQAMPVIGKRVVRALIVPVIP
jgi:hypothetical protein